MLYVPVKGVEKMFHIHTYRCGHASKEKESEYIEKAITVGEKEIVFTDHAPFPGNPFENRMKFSELTEYVNTLKNLKAHYAGTIDVKIGLEIEYLPSYRSYYKELFESNIFEVLMIGQHFYERGDGSFSFKDREREKEAEYCGNAILEGMSSGFFQYVAHPDRIFRYCEKWDSSASVIADKIWKSAKKYGIVLERNLGSMERKRQYWPEFWERKIPDVNVITGVDAHSVKQMIKFSKIEKGST